MGEAKLRRQKNPPPLCDDATFIRRVYLDLTGFDSVADAAQRFYRRQSSGKRANSSTNCSPAMTTTPRTGHRFWEERFAARRAT